MTEDPTPLQADDLAMEVILTAIQDVQGDSMKLWEYLACGRPVVTTAGPGYGDTVESMGAGLAAKPDWTRCSGYWPGLGWAGASPCSYGIARGRFTGLEIGGKTRR